MSAGRGRGFCIGDALFSAQRETDVIPPHLDYKARALLLRADHDGWPIAGRTFYLTGVLGDFYGTRLVSGAGNEDEELGLVLVCTRSVVQFTSKEEKTYE
jgi:hypothetical protein